PDGQGIAPLPLATAPAADGRMRVTSPADILAPIGRMLSDGGRFELRAETICRSLILTGDRVTAALIEHRPTRRQERVGARAVVVAADSFRTPQLLWACGVRPPALGRYLMDHPRSIAGIELDPKLVPTLTAEDEKRELVS